MAENGRRVISTTPEEAQTRSTINGHSTTNGVNKSESFSDEREEDSMGAEEQQQRQPKARSMQDIPLDFSVKRKSVESISESLTDDSQVSSVSPSASHDSHDLYMEHNKSNENSSNGSIRSHDQIGEPRTASRMSPNTRMGMSVFPGMPPNLLTNGNMLGGMPSMSPYMDHRLVHGNKITRPFKAYPKEALNMPLGYLGSAPGVGIPQLEGQALQNLNLSPDEIMNIYNQQLQVLRERDKQLLSMAKQHMDTTNQIRSGSSSSSSNNGTTMSPPIPTSATSPPRFPPPNNRPSPMVSSTSALTAAGRKRPKSLPDEQKDEAYWERRRKNNDAAKRSRDARRAKEDEIAIRAALLEQENLKLRVEVAALKTETARLRCMLYNS